MISSASNAQIKYLVKLQEKAALRKSDRVFVCEGRKMFEEVLYYDKKSIVKAYVTERFLEMIQEMDAVGKEAAADQMLTMKRMQEIDYEVVTEAVMKEAAQTVTPQGILAIVRQPEYTLEQMLGEKAAAGEKLDGQKGNVVVKHNTEGGVRLLLLESLRDPGNLGTIIRTAEGAGMDGVILNAESVDIFNPKVIRSTMGAIYRVPFLYVQDFYGLLENLKEQGIEIYAAHLAGSVEYDTVDYPKCHALMIGNEANGLTDRAAELAASCIRIPMDGRVESLNAGVAAAILMYETKRQLRRK